MFAHAPCGILVVEAASGNPVCQNDAAARFLPQSQLKDLYRADGSPCRPEDYPIARALAGTSVHREELAYCPKEGEHIFFMMDAVPICDDTGAVTKVFVTFIDISECRKAERVLRDSKEKLAFALGSANLMLWSLDIATGMGTVDTQQLSLLGYQADEIKPSFNAFLSIVHMEDRQRLLDCWDDYLENNAVIAEVTCRLRSRQGTWKWVQIRGQISERNARGEPLRAVGVLLDIDRLKRTEIALRESEEQLRSTLAQAPVGVATLAPSTRWLSMNSKMADIFGYVSAELLNGHHSNLRQLLHPDDAARFDAALLPLLDGEIPAMQLESRCLRRDDSVIWIELTASCIRNEEGRIKYLICIIDDRTPRKIIEQQRDQAQSHLQLATRVAQLAFWDWNVQTGEVFHSDEWKTQLGYSDTEMQAWKNNWIERIHPEDREQVAQYLNCFIASPSTEYLLECRVRHKNGTYRWFSVRGMPILDERGRLLRLLGTQYDITEQKSAQENTRRMSQHDPLTGLPNRGLLYEFSEHLIAASRRAHASLAVLFFDIDRFKDVNDTYGHRVGDGVLKEVADRLGQLMRAEDIIGRLGGDEFIAVLPKIRSREDAAVVATKALDLLGQHYLIDGIELALSPSIGISVFPADGSDIEMLIQNADAAMYEVKKSGCNNYRFFTAEAHNGSQNYFTLRSHLRQALEQSRFDLHYQPVLNTRTGALICVEALLRWSGPDEEGMNPAVWIATAEVSGLIVPLGKWIFEQACRQHQAWLQLGLPPISISINLSPVQLRAKELESSLDQTMCAFGIDPVHLEIEVSESTIMKNFDSAMAVLQRLKERGFRIVVDHFGAGSSNLKQLSQLPMDVLKVDRAFTPHRACDRTSLAVAETALALGRALDISVVAGGVESASDVALLQQHALDQGQGFHLGRPMPGARFAEWYRQHSMH